MRKRTGAVTSDSRKIDVPKPPPFENLSSASEEYSLLLEKFNKAVAQFIIYTDESSGIKEKKAARKIIKDYEASREAYLEEKSIYSYMNHDTGEDRSSLLPTGENPSHVSVSGLGGDEQRAITHGKRELSKQSVNPDHHNILVSRPRKDSDIYETIGRDENGFKGTAKPFK